MCIHIEVHIPFIKIFNMENIHILPTKHASRLRNDFGLFSLSYTPLKWNKACYVYITMNKKIKKGKNEWYIDQTFNKPYDSGGAEYGTNQNVVVLTNDPSLIIDGVQEVDDKFLKWLTENPNERYIEVKESKLNILHEGEYYLIYPKSLKYLNMLKLFNIFK